jgi:hypothetical protein
MKLIAFLSMIGLFAVLGARQIGMSEEVEHYEVLDLQARW